MSKKGNKKKKAKKAQKKIIKKKLAVSAKIKSPSVKAADSVVSGKKNEAKKISKIKKFKAVIGRKKSLFFESKNKNWSIALIFGTALISLFIQHYVFTAFNPESIKTNASQVKSNAQEAYKITTLFDIVNTEHSNSGYYLATGETDKNIYSFLLKSTGHKPVILKELVLTASGEIADGAIKNVRLFEGENPMAMAEIKGNKFVFKRFLSVLQPGAEKTYFVKTDVAEDGLSGSRFRLSLVNPSDILITESDMPVYALDTFPFDGAYATIVGWRKK